MLLPLHGKTAAIAVGLGVVAVAQTHAQQSTVPQNITARDLAGALSGSTDAFKATTNTNEAYKLTVVANSSHAVMSFTVAQPISSVGWLAFGTGTKMAGSDMIIFWPTSASASSWIISHRLGTGEVQPFASSTATAADIAVLPALSSSSGSSTTVTLLRALKPTYDTSATAGSEIKFNNITNLIHAYSSSNPGSGAIDTYLAQHDPGTNAATTLDLTQSASSLLGSTSPSVTAPPATFGIEQSTYYKLILAHAVCAGLAWMLFCPLMVLLATLGRRFGKWRPVHQWTQTLVTLGLTIAAVVLAIYAVNKTSTGSHNGVMGGHQVFGIVILALMLLQIAGGVFIHHKYDPQRTQKPIRNLGHIILGIILTVGGFVQVGTGFNLFKEKTGKSTPIAVWVIYGVIIGIVALSWIGSSIFSIILRRRNRVPLLHEKHLVHSSSGKGGIQHTNGVHEKPDLRNGNGHGHRSMQA